MKFILSTAVLQWKKRKFCKITAKDKKEKRLQLKETCLVSVGRRPFTDGLARKKQVLDARWKREELKPISVLLNVAMFMQWWCDKGAMLAHWESWGREEFVAETLAGPYINYNLIPGY